MSSRLTRRESYTRGIDDDFFFFFYMFSFNIRVYSSPERRLRPRRILPRGLNRRFVFIFVFVTFLTAFVVIFQYDSTETQTA